MTTLVCLICRGQQQRLNVVAAVIEQAALGRLVDEVPERTATARAAAETPGLPAAALAPEPSSRRDTSRGWIRPRRSGRPRSAPRATTT